MKQSQLRTTLIATFLISNALLGTAMANDSQRPDRRGPPPEAIEACAALSENDTCTFSSPRGDAEGMCVVAPNDGSLACKPEGGLGMKKP